MKYEDREKALYKNTGILAMGTLCSKIFTFLLLPLYTAKLTTSDYGTVDVLQTVASFAVPFITLQLSSGIFRFLIDQKKLEGQAMVITTGILIQIINTLIFGVGVLMVNVIWPFDYPLLFVVYFASHVFLDVTQNITRGFGNNVLYSVMNFVMTIVSLLFNVFMILGLGMKGESILIACTVSYFVAGGIAIWKQQLWKYFQPKRFSRQNLKEMLRYCLPLIPNAISWWITNTSDRMLILFFLGAASNGIYAAANKIPTIYTTIFNVYNVAWVEALSRSAGEADQEQFISDMLKKSVRLFGCICIGTISCMSLLFNVLIGDGYQEAFGHVYVLLVAIFFNSLCSLMGGIFTAFKKSSVIGKTTVVGAAVNIAVNLLLIRWLGLYAASISTLVSYLTIAIVRIRGAQKLTRLSWDKKYILQALIVLAVTTAGYFIGYKPVNVVILLLVAGWSYYSNREMLDKMLGSVLKKFLKK
ncbi:MAG: polysaccharide biosynthesis C-terminal domain-containing protein [Oscillospiraceae bacterium]|nr:polysaccharide biosynthesis C-terminal domain-containing protein [Oscillospiraceae bacterium]